MLVSEYDGYIECHMNEVDSNMSFYSESQSVDCS